jgi:endonuclease/exonuclease/phosphatase family metal-dependent hydrolase
MTLSSNRLFRSLSPLFLAFALGGSNLTSMAEQVRVMTFNIWHGGDAGHQPLTQTAEVIQTAKADVIGLQETVGFEKQGVRPDNGAALAKLLGFQYFPQGQGRGILSRFPILTNTPKKWGATLRLPSGRSIGIFNVHLAHAPYQPYQLLKIPYENAPFIQTADQAVQAARQARGAQVEQLLAEVRASSKEGHPLFITGDFNEPSHLDWTDRAARAQKCPLPVPYPSTRAVVDIGFRDCFRTVFPNEVEHTGWTWTPTTRPDDPKDRHDRIDFVFMGNSPAAKVLNCQIVGEDPRFADLVVQPYPSDHRAVVATVELP